MQRFHQLVFLFAIAGLSWLLMMAMHESGHIIGACLTGGQVTQVVLHPFAISRTDVAPNPHPAIVVWLGPIVGCVLPQLFTLLIPPRHKTPKAIATFLSGFCCIANGCYIGFGAFEQIGDCAVMLKTGTPLWILPVFGFTMILWGFYTWHRLGSPRRFLARPYETSPTWAYSLLLILISTTGCMLYLAS